LSITLVISVIFIFYKNKPNLNKDENYHNKFEMHNKSESNYFNRSGDESKLEMTDIIKYTKDESFKNIAKRI